MKDNRLKRAAALLLGVTLAAQSVSAVPPVSASEDVLAAETTETDPSVPEGLAYEISDEAVTITGYAGTATELTIPSEIEGYPVTSIGDWVSYWCGNLTSVTIPSSVTSIGNYAFSWCFSLTSVIIPEGVTSIGDGAFSRCDSLTSVTIPSSVTSIGISAFSDCTSLTEINVDSENTIYSSIYGVLFDKDRIELICCPGAKSGDYMIPEGVTSIGWGAFYGCSSLTSVTIPEGVTSIGDYVFSACSGLTEILVDSENTAYRSMDGVLFSKDQTELICCPSRGKSGDYAIPEGVTSILAFAFDYCSDLTSVTIPSSVTSIGEYAFSECESLTSVTIPEGVTSIGDSAFSWCSSLTNVTIPEGVTSIGDSAFYGCSSLTSVTIPEGVTSIEELAFGNCSNLTSVTIPEGVTSIRRGAFGGCSRMMDVFYAGNETEWGEIFIGDYNESLLNAAIHFDSPMPTAAPTETPTPAHNETAKPTETETPKPSETGMPAPAPESDFTAKETGSGVSVEKYIGTDMTVVVPDQIAGKPVTEIGANAFADTAVQEIVLPESVTGIGKGAFANCEKLESIVILGDEITIAGDAFTGCGNLTLKCLKNSAAQQYAEEHNIPCESLYYYGDVDLSGDLSAGDALSILKCVVKLTDFTDATVNALAHVSHQSEIGASDALAVLKIVVKLSDAEVMIP